MVKMPTYMTLADRTLRAFLNVVYAILRANVFDERKFGEWHRKVTERFKIRPEPHRNHRYEITEYELLARYMQNAKTVSAIDAILALDLPITADDLIHPIKNATSVDVFNRLCKEYLEQFIKPLSDDDSWYCDLRDVSGLEAFANFVAEYERRCFVYYSQRALEMIEEKYPHHMCDSNTFTNIMIREALIEYGTTNFEDLDKDTFNNYCKRNGISDVTYEMIEEIRNSLTKSAAAAE